MDRDEISNLRRKILVLKRYLSPQKEALKTLQRGQGALKIGDGQDFYRSYETNVRILEELDLSRERCRLLQEQINNKLTEQVNRRMYIFSLITAVFLPISSVASL